MNKFAIGMVLAISLGKAAAAVDLSHESLAGVHIGDSQAAVRQLLGKPLKESRPALGQATGQMESSLSYPHLEVDLGNGKVTSVHAYAPSPYRTSRGVRIGDTTARALSVYHTLTQRDDPHYFLLTLVPRNGHIVEIFLGQGPE